MLITSRQNELIKHARAVCSGRNRHSIFIEGLRLGEEARRSPLTLETVIYTARLLRQEAGRAVLSGLERRAPRVVEVTEAVFDALSDTEVHQGLLVLARTPATGPHLLEMAQSPAPLYVVLHQLNNPSNVGAILRTAEAAGATGVIATAGTTYLLAPKALRGSMGAAFRLPLWLGGTLPEVVRWCRKHGAQTVCADIRATKTHADFDWTRPAALVLGAEAHGLNEQERDTMNELIRIPMRAQVESLNVAVAAGITLYEAARQRGFN